MQDDSSFFDKYGAFFIKGLKNTILISMIGVVLGAVLGALIALAAPYLSKKLLSSCISLEALSMYLLIKCWSLTSLIDLLTFAKANVNFNEEKKDNVIAVPKNSPILLANVNKSIKDWLSLSCYFVLHMLQQRVFLLLTLLPYYF
jgi:predicted lysophospholipase L1 biosynthesis ABC-type transport system permease subunit